MNERETLLASIRGVNGRDPGSVMELLSVLIHPDVVANAKAYLQVHDKTDVCKKYQAPWNCAMEAKSFTETVYNGGWSTALSDVIENWCVNCTARLYGEDPGDIAADPMVKNWLEDPTVNYDDDNPEEDWLRRDVDGC